MGGVRVREKWEGRSRGRTRGREGEWSGGAIGKVKYCVVIGWIEGYAYIALSILLL